MHVWKFENIVVNIQKADGQENASDSAPAEAPHLQNSV